MPFSDLLIDLCDILRYVSTPDEYGQHTKSWGILLANQPCRLTKPVNNEVQRDKEIVLADFVLFIDQTDVTEKDRIESGGITYEILSVSPYRGLIGDHLELMLRTVR